MTFASKKEALRALDLAAMEQGGVISDLKFQPAFSIEIKGSKVCTYIADFQYVHDGKVIVEDVKGFKTKEYILKSKLMKAVLGITVKET